MCQSSLYAAGSGEEQLLYEEVARLQVDGERLTIERLMGEPVSLTARIREIDLMRHRIVIEKT